MIAEDFGPVRVLATESIAGTTVEGARARTGPKDPRGSPARSAGGRGQRSPQSARSFANTSADRRVSIVFGFHRRDAVLNVVKKQSIGETVVYDEQRIHQRSRAIQLGIDARAAYYPHETPYVYRPLVGESDDNRFNEATRDEVLAGYHLLNLGI